MNSAYRMLLASVLAGLILTGVGLLIAPKDTVVTGPSCPICLDVNGGRYHHTQRGLPLRFLYHNDDDPVADGPGYDKRTIFKIPQFAGDWALWSAVSAVCIVGMRKVRNK